MGEGLCRPRRLTKVTVKMASRPSIPCSCRWLLAWEGAAEIRIISPRVSVSRRRMRMDETYKQIDEQASRGESGNYPSTKNLSTIGRRDWFKASVGGSVGLALGGLIDVRTGRAATKELKLSNLSVLTTFSNFCSCGCGMIAAVRQGTMITMDGDPHH